MEAASYRVCKICNRRFANGKAMGGHMRSHLAKLPLPHPKPHPEPQEETLRPEANSGLSFDAISDRTVPEDRESVTESRRIHVNIDEANSRPSQEQSKRTLPSVQSTPPSTVAAAPLLSDVDVAISLLLLSVDTFWRGPVPAPAVQKAAVAAAARDTSDEHDTRSGESSSCKMFRCDVCKKLFRSYQALGGHRSSHTHSRFRKETRRHHGVSIDCKRVFECPYCHKQFHSGQGLGGHKKVHLLNAAAGPSKKKKTEKRPFIDVNLPPVAWEDDDHSDREVII
ncbi:hypothetical protein SAY87_030378 [Trapa incisa]|uniref:C2H2-type domain-containing protein n=1 Tax=Trapa incisa TaxID=236973 RepID=A0AAN7QK42_9MYRT|nr:hypothetical protein SAY87_030378 [Trapa incisa]